MDRLLQLEVFVRTAELGSLSKAAESLQIIAANRYPDFIEAGIDVAIRTREQEPDSGIIVRRIGQMRRVLGAAPSYLAGRGHPVVPADLMRHDVLIYNLANDPYSLSL